MAVAIHKNAVTLKPEMCLFVLDLNESQDSVTAPAFWKVTSSTTAVFKKLHCWTSATWRRSFLSYCNVIRRFLSRFAIWTIKVLPRVMVDDANASGMDFFRMSAMQMWKEMLISPILLSLTHTKTHSTKTGGTYENRAGPVVLQPQYGDS